MFSIGKRWGQIPILDFVRNTGAIHKKVNPVLSGWRVKHPSYVPPWRDYGGQVASAYAKASAGRPGA